MALYNEIVARLKYDTEKYVLVGNFIRKKLDSGIYEPYDDLEYFLRQSIYKQDWRNRVIQDKGRKCTICGVECEKGQLYVIFKGNIKNYLKLRGIKTIDQALRVDDLWDTKHGEIRCKKHLHSKSIEVYNPSLKDKEYIKTYLKVDGVKGLSELLKVPLPTFIDYLIRENML